MVFCSNCGTQLSDGTKFCPNCGKELDAQKIVYIHSSQQDIYVHERKSKGLAMTLCFFLGWLGVHKFYLRKYFSGSLYLLFSLTGIHLFLSVLDFVIMLLTPKSAFHKRYDK